MSTQFSRYPETVRLRRAMTVAESNITRAEVEEILGMPMVRLEADLNEPEGHYAVIGVISNGCPFRIFSMWGSEGIPSGWPLDRRPPVTMIETEPRMNSRVEINNLLRLLGIEHKAMIIDLDGDLERLATANEEEEEPKPSHWSAPGMYDLAQWQFQAGMTEEALLSLAISIQLGSESAQLFLGCALLSQQDYDRSLGVFKHLKEAGSRTGEAAYDSLKEYLDIHLIQ